MKKILILAILAIAYSTTTLAQGIQFFHGTFQEALKQAEKENKKLFVDVYTSWCGPCKKMAKTVFTQKAVGDFYNKNFICLKIDAEKGEGPSIRDAYSVSGYPTLMYLDAKGDVVKKLTSGVDASFLIELGKSVLTVNDNFEELKQKYAQNKLNKQELYQYLVLLKSKGLDKEVAQVFGEYFVLAAQEKKTEKLLKMIPEYAGKSDSKAFQYLVKQRQQFAQAIGEEKVNKCIHDFYLNEFNWTRFETEEAYWTAKKTLAKRIKINKELSLNLDNNHYNNTQNEDEYIKTAKILIEKYYHQDDAKIANILGAVKFVKKKENFLQLEKWGKRAIELNDSFMNNVQLAVVYMGLKEESKANEYFAKAEKIGKETNDPYLSKLPQVKEMFKQIFQ